MQDPVGNRYQALFEHATVGILVADADSNYLDANPSMCDMLGYGRDELIGLHASDIVIAAPGSIEATLEAIETGREYLRAWRFRRKDGTLFDAEVTVTHLPDGNLLGFVRDISDRQRAEAVSRRLAAIVESSADAIVSTDLDGIVTSWNHGAERMSGYPAHEMLGTELVRLVPDELRESDRRIVERIRRGESVAHFETRRLTRDGLALFVSMSASPISDADGAVIGVSRISRDITAQKRNEHELERLTRLYAALSQVNQAIVWTTTRESLLQKVCDVLVEHGRFHMVWIGFPDGQSERIVPVAACGDHEGCLDEAAIFADEHAQGRGPTGKALRETRTVICNDLQSDPDTAPWRHLFERNGLRASAAVPIRENGAVCGTLNVYADEPGFFRDKEVALLEEAAADISFALDNLAREAARKRAEAVAGAERHFSDTMIESMPGVLYFYDVNGRFLRWNRSFATVTGFPDEEIARMHPLDFFSGKDKPSLQRRIAEVFDHGDSFVEAPLLCKDGSEIPYFFTGRRITWEGIPCLVGMGIDVSGRERAEAALRELNETLEQKVQERTLELQAALIRADAADRLKSAFLATMSHELRTPLNSIIGFTGILLQGMAGPLNTEQHKQLGMVRTSARHLLELINDVLDLSRIEAGQLEVRAEPFDPAESIRRVANSMIPQAEKKGVPLHLEVSVDAGDMLGDRRRFEQILLNLLSNALKFTVDGAVTLGAQVIEEPLAGPEARSRSALRLSIADTGIGIRTEDLDCLFRPFQQIDGGLTRMHEGTGLGLAICQRLTTLMGGTITVASEWEKGSTFTLTLPLHRTPSA